jgi:hypothetical protein
LLLLLTLLQIITYVHSLNDRFVNMTLPRSVKEMSKLDFLPRHCESENFRGFSFIGDSFPIPQRNKSEEEHYWNNVDDDGQSLSECASSVFDDDLNEVVPPPEPELAKKKRPPRKKKKKQQTIPLETTNEEHEKSDTASQAEIELSSDKPEVVESSLTPINKPSASDTSNEQESAAIVRKEDAQSLDGIKSATSADEPKPPQARIVATNSPKPSNSAAPKLLNPSAKSWQAPKTHAPNSSLAASPVKNYSPPPVHTPKPGTWASLAVSGKPNQTRKTVALTQQAARAPVSPMSSIPVSPKKPTTDWRTHVVSPRQPKLAATRMNPNLAPPPPMAPGQSAWPSLGDFPPPPGTKAMSKQQIKPVGAWGKAT